MNRSSFLGCLVAFLLIALASACVAGSQRKMIDQKIEVIGVVDDGFKKSYPFCVQSSNGVWALNVVNIPSGLLRKKVKVTGLLQNVDGVKILTKVYIDGLYFQTPEEWFKSNQQKDPFKHPL